MENTIDLPKRVQHIESKKIYTIGGVVLIDEGDASHEVTPGVLEDIYEEWLDPKDVEIARLLALCKKQAEQLKPLRKKRRVMLKGEKDEIIELIRKGEGNTAIANEYKVSDTTISKIRVTLRKAGEDV